jgi:hypothetical protein
MSASRLFMRNLKSDLMLRSSDSQNGFRWNSVIRPQVSPADRYVGKQKREGQSDPRNRFGYRNDQTHSVLVRPFPWRQESRDSLVGNTF